MIDVISQLKNKLHPNLTIAQSDSHLLLNSLADTLCFCGNGKDSRSCGIFSRRYNSHRTHKMNRLSWRRFLAIILRLVGILIVLVLPVTVYGGVEAHEANRFISQDNEIYGSREAISLVIQARQHDPMFCLPEQVDRDNAILLYEKAIAAQPSAKINASLADRIAQLYAFYEDKEKGVIHSCTMANEWWSRCVKLTSPNQLLWAQAQMGLASMAVIVGDYFSALRHYNEILNMDISEVELPDWKNWPDGNTDQEKTTLEKERTRFLESVGDIQVRAAEKKIYVLSHISKPAVINALQDMASRYKGTSVGNKASKMVAKIRSQASKDMWMLPENFLNIYVSKIKPKAFVRKQKQQNNIVSVEPVKQIINEAKSSDWNFWGLGVVVIAAIMSVMVTVGILLWIRRRNRLPKKERSAQ